MKKKKLSFKNVTTLLGILLPWVFCIGLLITPVPSVVLNNYIRSSEYYKLETYNKVEHYKYKINDIVTVSGEPNIKDLEIAKKHVVTDDDVNYEIDLELENYSEDTDLEIGMTVENGMNINVSYTGTIDGEEFDNSSAENQDIALGSGTIMDSLEEAINGHEVGETFEAEVVIPDTYDEKLAGKTAIYNITINSASIQTQLDHNSVTDEFIKSNIKDYDTVDAYRANVKKEVENYYDLEYDSGKKSAILDALKEVTTVEVPSDLLKEELEIYKLQFGNMYCDEGQTLEEYLSAYYDMTIDDFTEQIKSDVENSIQNVLICQKFADDLNIKISDDDLLKYIDDLSMGTSYGSSEPEQVYALYETEYMSGKDYIKRMALCDKVLQYFSEEATFVETEEDTSENED